MPNRILAKLSYLFRQKDESVNLAWRFALFRVSGQRGLRVIRPPVFLSGQRVGLGTETVHQVKCHLPGRRLLHRFRFGGSRLQDRHWRSLHTIGHVLVGVRRPKHTRPALHS